MDVNRVLLLSRIAVSTHEFESCFPLTLCFLSNTNLDSTSVPHLTHVRLSTPFLAMRRAL
jgi:hypothetical protein